MMVMYDVIDIWSEIKLAFNGLLYVDDKSVENQFTSLHTKQFSSKNRASYCFEYHFNGYRYIS